MVVEGWRYYTHSFSLVNQYQCRELLRRDDVRLHHRDVAPLAAGQPDQRVKWQRQSGLLPAADEDRIRAVGELPEGQRPDVTYRIYFPYDFTPAAGGRTAVFAVTEYLILRPFLIRGGQRFDEVMDGNDVLLITPSRWSKRGMVNSGAPPERVHVVPHGFDGKVFNRPECEQRQQWRKEAGVEDSFVFLAVGAMYGHKGMLALLQGLAAVARKHPHVRLILKGMDAVYASKRFLVNTMQQLSAEDTQIVRPRVRYIGQTLPAQQMARLYQTADVLASPSFGEGFNLPVLEAAACGLPAICTCGGPTDEFTTEAFTMRIDSRLEPLEKNPGFRLQPQYDHFVDLMFKAVEDEPYIRTAREAAPAHVSPRYTWERVTDELVCMLRTDVEE